MNGTVIESTTGLSVDEKIELAACEQSIKTGLTAFGEAGAALEKIRVKRLYRESHKTFDDYCNKRLGIKPRYAYRLITAFEVTKDIILHLENVADRPQLLEPANEWQVRPLAELPSAERGPAFEAAADIASPQPPTSAHVAEAVRSVKSGSAFEAGQKVTVVSPHAPASGEEVEVVEIHPKKPIIIAKTADGERRTYLKTQLSGGELSVNTEKKSTPTKTDHLESAQFLAQVAEGRVQQLEALLKRAIPLLRMVTEEPSQREAQQVAREAESLLGV